MRTRQLGSTGPVVSALGLGCMGMSDVYGPADRNEGIATIRAALDAGITVLDTGDFYDMGTNELLIRDALAGRDRTAVVLSVKFGALRDPDGAFLAYDGRPMAARTIHASQRRISRTTSRSSTHCARSRARRTRPSRSWRSRGSPRAAITSCRSSREWYRRVPWPEGVIPRRS